MTTIQDEITNAIGAHGKWKQRLYAYIATGKLEATPDTINADDTCAFGQWLRSPDVDAQQKANDHYRRVLQLHTRFHQEAGRVVELATQGQKADASRALELGGAYHTASSALTLAMMQWKMSIH